MQAVGLGKKFARTIGISVDHRRRNKSAESLNANVARLKNYLDRLVIGGAALKMAQFKGEIAPVRAAPSTETEFAPITDEMRKFQAAYTLYNERKNVKLVGVRAKIAKRKAEEAAAKAKKAAKGK